MMLLIYLFILFPIILTLLYISIKLDLYFRFTPIMLINRTINTTFSIFLISIGMYIIWWAYTNLVIIGDGSPAQMLGQTKRLVTKGPYSIVRHPSVIGKFSGVLGVGILFNSSTFVFIVIPLLLFYALFERVREEKRLIQIWKDEYLNYKKTVPFIIPRLRDILLLSKSSNR